MDDGDLRSYSHGQMSKFKGNISAADKQNLPGKLIQLQKLLACREVFDSRYLQIGWSSASRDDDLSPLQDLTAHLNCRWSSEASPTMERGDASLGKSSFAALRDGVGESVLKAHQFRPVNVQLLGADSIALHSASPINCFAPPTSTFLGSHPRNAHVPPNGRESTTATC